MDKIDLAAMSDLEFMVMLIKEYPEVYRQHIRYKNLTREEKVTILMRYVLGRVRMEA